ncbi:MAG: hypothetical protein UGF89_13500 [Acutalibacteraceae bacterium]|nr:hypothetical protein [Acutalibacteraceae bacterium]
MSKTNIDIIKAYMEFFRDKSPETPRVSTFVDEYRQHSGGYIELATDFENIDIIKSKPEDEKNTREKESEAYYNFLTSSIHNEDGKTNIERLCDLTGLSEKEILHPSTIPNQKWHLMISYLGMKQFHKKRPMLHMVSCPELWIWMFEVSGECEIDKIEKHAVNYKLKQECDGVKYNVISPCNNWKCFIKKYRKKLHKIVVEEYKNNFQ